MKGKAVKAMTIGAFILGATLPRMVAQDEPVYYLNGDAVVTGEDCYQLTPAINTQNGSVWYADQVDLNQPLDLQFTLNLGTDDSGGADGRNAEQRPPLHTAVLDDNAYDRHEARATACQCIALACRRTECTCTCLQRRVL